MHFSALLRLICLIAVGAVCALPTSLVKAETATTDLTMIRMAQKDETAPVKDTPEERMNRRFPQNVKVGHIIGLPVLDYDDVTLGHVIKVVRSPDGKIRLIVQYSKWFGWFGRPVAVPIEGIIILARQLNSLDMMPEDFAAAKTWSQENETILASDDIIKIGLGRR